MKIKRYRRYREMLRSGWARIFPVYAHTRVSVRSNGYTYSKSGRGWIAVTTKKKKRHVGMEARRSSS